jgi:hypothetical protein
MAIAFRSVSSLAYAIHGTTHTVSAPSGIANGDILIADTFVANGASDPGELTPPAGWTAVTASVLLGPNGGLAARTRTYWKRAASESGSYVFTSGNTDDRAEIVIRAFSGCIASGSPIDAFSTASGSGTTTTAPSITTTVANTLLSMYSSNWQANGADPVTGWTERYDFVVTSIDKNTLNASAGATGTVVVSSNGNNGVGDPWSTCLIALKPAGGTPASLLKVWNGSAWVAKPVKVWSGSAWVTKPVKTWNGSAWI